MQAENGSFRLKCSPLVTALLPSLPHKIKLCFCHLYSLGKAKVSAIYLNFVAGANFTHSAGSPWLSAVPQANEHVTAWPPCRYHHPRVLRWPKKGHHHSSLPRQCGGAAWRLVSQWCPGLWANKRAALLSCPTL